MELLCLNKLLKVGKDTAGTNPAIFMYNAIQFMQFTSTYSSPERSNNADQRKVDVWAAGCILHELCTGRSFMRPQHGGSIYALIAQLSDPSWKLPDLPRCMSCWTPMLNAMLCPDPALRPLPRDLLRFDVLKYGPSFKSSHVSYHPRLLPRVCVGTVTMMRSQTKN